MRRAVILLGLLLVAALTATAALRISHHNTVWSGAAELTGGDPRRGKELAREVGCIACHEMPGFSGTKPVVGPPLSGFSQRSFVGGAAANTAEHVIRFIQDPRSVAPRTAMPKLNLSEQDARDLAAFVYTL